MKIVVNGTTVDCGYAVLSYAKLVGIAGMSGQPSVTYRVRSTGAAGILAPGDAVAVSEGLVVNLAHTGNA